jgi:acyl-CoA dehydrogenase
MRASKLPLTESHEIFRMSARRFFESECAPFQRVWEKDGCVPRAVWLRAGELGFLCPRVGEDYGGFDADFLYSVIVAEEQARAGVVAPALSRSDIVTSYIAAYGTEAQKTALLPHVAAGTALGALAVAETSREAPLVAQRDGQHYVIKGIRSFVVGGLDAHFVLVSARTGDGTSLFVIETGKTEGLDKSKAIKKLGQAASGTVDLVFDEVRVPASALLGEREGLGALQIAARLPEERLLAAAAAIAGIERALQITTDYVKERRAFKQRIIDFQNTRFRLAEAKTEAMALRIFLERCLREFLAGSLKTSDDAALYYATADKLCAIVDDGVQLHGGYGYILDYAIARMWTDGRLGKILACTDETVRDIVEDRPTASVS